MAVLGCKPATPIDAVDRGPQLDSQGVRRSLVLDSPYQQYLTSRQGVFEEYAWYADRNDRLPAVAAGYALPSVQSSVTITRDRQYQSSGRVHDHFSSTTYRSEVRRGIR